MTQYTVINAKTGYREDFYSLTEAKAAMRTNNARCYKTKIYRNGDWIPCGEVMLKGNNKSMIANSPCTMQQANY